VQWSQTENIRWKVAVPGKGSSSPIIWEDKIYLMTAIELANTAEATGADDQVASSGLVADPQNLRTDANRGGEPRRRGRATPPNNASAEVTLGVAGGQERQDQERQEQGGRGERGERGGRQGRGRGREPQVVNPHQFVVLCLERSTGKELWRKVVCEAVPHEAGHGTNTFSAASPIVDGQRIYANFGSRGFYCLDMQGEVLWQKELGQMSTRNGFGEGSSASVYGQTVVIPWDHEGDSFIVALDAQSGREKWRAERAERTTWATPLITPFGNRVQVVTNGNRVRSYDLETGDLLWECGGQVGNPVPTPVRFEDQVVCMTGYQGYAIASMALDSQGDITGTDKVAWTGGGAAPYVPSPVLYDGLLYFVKSNNPVVVVRDVKTGDVIVDETRLPKMRVIYASPVAADGKIYFCSREGVTVVLKHGPTAEVLAVNELGETIDASPAIVGSELYIRGESHLYCIAAD
jgi:outer membrane protein assembly factor BamB